jgi:mRNA interferase HigB
MHVISYRRLREYAEKQADSRDTLDNWFKVAGKLEWRNLVEVQAVFPKAEAVGNFTVFNIKGNSYRLIASIDYEKQLIHIKYILTHAEYDKEQ